MMFFGNQELKGKIDESIVVHGDNDEFDIVPKGRKKLIDTDELIEKIKARSKPKAKAPEPEPEAETQEPAESLFGDFDGEFDFADEGHFAKEAEPPAEPPLAKAELLDADELFGEPDKDPEAPRFVAPDIIQFRVMARAAEGFNGLDMLKAFRIAQLEYGSLKIFERYDANNLVDFGVACMVEGGTFPDHDVDQFYCPGLVFFMQPALLDEAVRVFDDYLEALNIVAVELDGDLLDHEKNPLTNATIKMIRQSL